MADVQQNEWVARVLGVQIGSGSGAPAVDLHAAADAWRTASETVDAQIAALQRALLATDDEELQEIGQYGVNAVTGGFKTKLTAALMGAEAGQQSDRKKLAALASQFRAYLESDERVEACDENPFDVPTSIRVTLVPALDQLTRSAAA
jgi:hypothetical protein